LTSVMSDKDKGAVARMRAIAELGKRAIEVGVLADHGSEAAQGGVGLTVADVATFNEFGTATTPERPIILGYCDEKQKEALDLLGRMSKAVVSGKITAVVGFEALGLKLVAGMQERMSNGIAPPNAPSTIARKGSSAPTIDSGQLRSALTSRTVPR
jgi:hypothetical protein